MKMAVTRMVLGLILAATLAMYYLETNHDISLEHRRFHGDLAALQRIEATLNQDILKVRFGFLEDYNGFEKPLQTMNKVVEELRQVPLFVPEADRAFLGRSVTELAGSIQEKAALLERFKGLESILDDSMREFPVEANALLERIAAKEGGREVELLLNELIRQVLLYSLDSNARQEPELRRILSRLDAWRGKLEEDAALGTLIAHVHSILQIQPAVETVTRQLVSLPIAARTDEMLRLYEERFAASLRKSHFYRMVLKLLCMALIAGIGYAIYALKRINNDLERRVLKRTTDLLKKNKELQTEAAERIQAQGDLAYERDLLRTLLEHSPDQIYFKDRDSRFIKCSQTLVERFHLNSAEELVGKSDFDFFTEEHARPAFEDEQAIIRTGEPVVGRVEKEVWKDSDKITWALTTKGPLRDKTGGIIGTFGTTKDITTMKEAEEALARVNKELVEISRHAGMAEVATSVLHNVGNV